MGWSLTETEEGSHVLKLILDVQDHRVTMVRCATKGLGILLTAATPRMHHEPVFAGGERCIACEPSLRDTSVLETGLASGRVLNQFREPGVLEAGS